MATPPSTGGRRPDTKLPKGLEPLPDSVPKEEWLLWPRKPEAHIVWGVSERRITGKCTTRMLCQYMCPDGSIRLDPEEMTATFGPPGAEQEKQRLKAGTSDKLASSVDVDIDDPLPAVLTQVLLMLKDAREDSRKILALVIDPANQLTSNLLVINDRQATRIGALEKQLQAELEASSNRLLEQHMLDIEIRREVAKEQRRATLMRLLQEQVPAIVSKWTGATLVDFVDGIDPATIDALLQSQLLPAEKQRALQALYDRMMAANAAKAAPEPAPSPTSTTNGATAPQPTGV